MAHEMYLVSLAQVKSGGPSTGQEKARGLGGGGVGCGGRVRLTADCWQNTKICFSSADRIFL